MLPNTPMSQQLSWDVDELPLYSSTGIVQSPTSGLGGMGSGILGSITGSFFNKDGGFNWDAVSNIGKGISAFGGLYSAMNQNKLAKQTLGLQTRAFETNLANQLKTYNNSMEDRLRARGAMEGRSQEETDALVASRRL